MAEGPGICLGPRPSFLFIDIISVPNVTEVGAQIGYTAHLLRSARALVLPKRNDSLTHSLFLSVNKRQPTVCQALVMQR